MSILMNKEGKGKIIVLSIDRFGNEEERIWATPNGAQDLLLALYSGVSPVSAQTTYIMPVSEWDGLL